MKYKNILESLAFVLFATFTSGYSYAHSGPLNAIAVKACAEKAKSQACQYEGGHNDLYIGSCQYMAEALMCVRSQPIQKIEPDKAKSEKEHTHKDDTPTN